MWYLCKISFFTEHRMFHHAKSLVPEIKSYIQDTPDLLRQLEKLKTHKFKEGTFPVSIDVVGLYPNIPHEEGLSALKDALNTREDKSVPTDLLVEIMRDVLENKSLTNLLYSIPPF